MKKLTLVLVLVLLCVSTGYSFDGMRKGFVLGGGLGFAPSATFEIDGFQGQLDNSGVGLNLVIGYAWDEFNMIVYEGNVAAYSVEGYDISQGFNGASWYHYFSEMGKSAYIVVGLGAYVFQVDQYDADPGGALLLGGGYEFARHWQVGAYFSTGKTSESSLDFKHSHFNILVSGVAF
ncbi:MAG: hypothetical protein DWP97_04035 [Calditrichaeota bacterium]|nr:MAG: hypothetical protein DWP97_04035 [Calditrichota bacterium]